MSVGKTSRRQVQKIRAKIYDRDEHKCVASVWGSPCAGALTIQHAVKRGMGGSAIFDSPRFLRTMCWRHNELDASNADFRRMALLNGWSMRRQEALVSEVPVPVLYADGSWYRLGDDFSRELIEDAQAAVWRAQRLEWIV